MSVIAYIGIGSNLGDRKENCRRAIELLSRAGRVTKVSSLYCTEPVGFKAQPEFINMVVELETSLPPDGLLDVCEGIEKEMGRKRQARWGPRAIDLDILLYGEKVIKTERLTIPHPLMDRRGFVLVPLAEIAPDAVHPVTGKTSLTMLQGLDDTSRVERCDRQVGLE